MSKEQGRMTFKDVSIFNQAMLAKQSWRLLKNPDDLLATIMKGKYFIHRNFIRAQLGKHPSYVWRSLMWGKIFP